MNLTTRVLSDLMAQNQRLREEFETWRGRAALDGDLPQHHSQVERTTHTLKGMLDKIIEPTPLAPGANPATASLDSAMELRRNLGTVHLVWDFFRDKFAQRDTELFSDHLGAADDLAHACYEPFRDAWVEMTSPEQLKAPPLLFYSSDRSPFAQARASAFRPLGLSPRDIERFRLLLLHLPVPVIGLPWSQAGSVPSLVFVGHEAGHVVAEDFGLAKAFDALIEGLGLPDGRTAVWKTWADETFADVFGILATGSAYVDRLTRILADSLQNIRGQRIDRDKPGAYPTASLRVVLCQHVQQKLGLGVDPTWHRTYRSPSGDSSDFADDVAPVAEALLHGPYPSVGDRGLEEILPWNPARDADASDVADEALAGGAAPIPFDVRTWVAAAVQAQTRDADRFVRRQLDDKLAELIVESREEGTRAAAEEALREHVATIRGFEVPGTPRPSMQDLDWQNGASLAAMLMGDSEE